MATVAISLNIEEERIVAALQEAGEKLDGASGEVVLDFLSVRRIDRARFGPWRRWQSSQIRSPSKFVIRGVNVHVYKVLKLVKLARRFSFTA